MGLRIGRTGADSSIDVSHPHWRRHLGKAPESQNLRRPLSAIDPILAAPPPRQEFPSPCNFFLPPLRLVARNCQKSDYLCFREFGSQRACVLVGFLWRQVWKSP